MDSCAHVALSTDAGVSPEKPHNMLPQNLADLSRPGRGADLSYGRC